MHIFDVNNGPISTNSIVNLSYQANSIYDSFAQNLLLFGLLSHLMFTCTIFCLRLAILQMFSASKPLSTLRKHPLSIASSNSQSCLPFS